MAERFVKEHLLNPQEFWTKMPLPSVAANDPLNYYAIEDIRQLTRGSLRTSYGMVLQDTWLKTGAGKLRHV